MHRCVNVHTNIHTNKHVSNFTFLAQATNAEASYQLKGWLLYSKWKAEVFIKRFWMVELIWKFKD